MIANYRDLAANERTFLAWVRTAISVIAFGVVIERLDVASGPPALLSGQLTRLPHDIAPVRVVGLSCAFVGVVLLGMAALRFIRTNGRIATQEECSMPGDRLDMALTGIVSSIGIIMCLYVALRVVA